MLMQNKALICANKLLTMIIGPELYDEFNIYLFL